MPFGLAGAPSIYQKCVSSNLVPIKKPWLQVHIDDIFIFFKDPDEDLEPIREVMSISDDNQLYIRSENVNE